MTTSAARSSYYGEPNRPTTPGTDRMSAIGASQKWSSEPSTSAFGGEADLAIHGRHLCSSRPNGRMEMNAVTFG